MEFFKTLEIHLLDINKEMTDTWNRFFKGISNVKVHNDTLENFLNNNDVQGIVSPANSFGLMDGGYDKAIIDYFGNHLMKRVQDYIIENYCGEQPVGTAFSIPIYPEVYDCKYLIHCPTMRTPEVIRDSRVIYSCMRSTLIECMRKEMKSVIIPAFGGCTGKVDKRELANMMRLAYEQLINTPNQIDWNSPLRFEDYEKTHYSHSEEAPIIAKDNSTQIAISHFDVHTLYKFESNGSHTLA